MAVSNSISRGLMTVSRLHQKPQRNPQLNSHGELIHLLSTEGLPKAIIHQILDTAETFLSVNEREVRRCPCCVARVSSTCF